ncbi:MAG TPA: TldD/PmbA family protein [Patescibacteria group bacterium]|nr:TldD/PmbA family protein [Patescibacteria group bacterium]
MIDMLHITDIDKIKDTAAHILIESGKLPDTQYVDVRLEATEGVGAYVEDSNPRQTSKDWYVSMGVRVIGGSRFAANGFYGRQLGIIDFQNFTQVLQEAITIARTRALENAKQKEVFINNYKDFSKTLSALTLAPININQATIEAEFAIDPRNVSPKQITDYAMQCAIQAKNYHSFVKRVEVVLNSSITRQLFVSSEGTCIDQSYCSSGGTIFLVSVNDSGEVIDLYHHTGNQLGFEALTEGKNSHEQTFEQFSRHIADETVQLCNAKPAPATDKAVTVVLDPDLVALFAHEIIGHPSELDRALKMETGYAGRSWFFKDLQDNMVGKQVGSKLLTAFSDPTLKGGYGHYAFDDEGTQAKRVYHIKDGIYHDFMNSRQTAVTIGKEPNGHYKANDASVVPLIRMSQSAIAPGKTDPKKIISEVTNGYYAVGHRIPSISESRENFQIAPRLIYEIKNGQVGQVYRNGRITADSKDFFMSIDALGNDFNIFPIPNCGKGQPMQAKQVGNGGPTARARARIAKGN